MAAPTMASFSFVMSHSPLVRVSSTSHRPDDDGVVRFPVPTLHIGVDGRAIGTGERDGHVSQVMRGLDEAASIARLRMRIEAGPNACDADCTTGKSRMSAMLQLPVAPLCRGPAPLPNTPNQLAALHARTNDVSRTVKPCVPDTPTLVSSSLVSNEACG